MKALLAIGLGVVVLVFFLRGGRYRRLFAWDHLGELAVQVHSLWRAADDAREPSAETTVHFATSAGLIVVHTCRALGADRHHHLSLSWGQELLAMGAARTLIGFALDVPRLDPRRITVSHAVSVTHATFTVTADEESSFAAAPLPAGQAELRERMARAMEARPSLVVAPEVPPTAAA